MSRFGEADEGPEPLEAGRKIASFHNIFIKHPAHTIEALNDMKAAFEAMSVKELIYGSLCKDGKTCALGAYAQYKGIPQAELEKVVPEDSDGYQSPAKVAKWAAGKLPISKTLAVIVQEENDYDWDEPLVSGEERYKHVLDWVNRTLADPAKEYSDQRSAWTAWFDV